MSDPSIIERPITTAVRSPTRDDNLIIVEL